MLIRNILEESVRKFDEVKAVKWLKEKGNYGKEAMAN